MGSASGGMRCLVIEPEAALQENYADALVHAGFEVLVSYSLADVLADAEVLGGEPPSVLLIAVNDYVEYHEPRLQRVQQQLLKLRKRWPFSSLLILADGTPTQWLHSLAVDDLLPKIAPLATITRRSQLAAKRFERRQPQAAQTWQVLVDAPNAEIQSGSGLLRVSGKRLRVTLSEYAVLTDLLTHQGKRRSYAELAAALGYPADPLSVMALIQAAQQRFSEVLNEAVELIHLPHFGYALSLVGATNVAESSVSEPGEINSEDVEPYGLIDEEAAKPGPKL